MVSRALERTGSDRHPPPLTSGGGTSIGSLPHRDAHEAAAFVIATHADLPAAPQLPRRSPRERMVAQGAAGIDGVTVDATGVVRITHALCTEALVASTFDDGWGGTLAFLDVIAGRRKPVKLQLTGPVTLGLAPVLASFLESGGWVAWGAVPTSGTVGDEPDPCWRRLVGLWCELMRAGCDAGLLRRQALVTPACGLAEHGVTQAARVLRLTTQIAERVQDQAIASRLSVGA